MRSGNAAGYVVAAVLGGIAGGISVRVLDRAQPLPLPYREALDRPGAAGMKALDGVIDVVRRAGPAVVNIDTITSGNDSGGSPFAPSEQMRQGQGSGFIINGRQGLVVTNSHVVERARRIEVTLSDGRSFPATVRGRDPIGDVALLQIKGASNLPEVAFGDSDALQIGQVTVAIGNPLGLHNTVTHGVLSQIGRRLDGQIAGIPLDDLIQTDAAINPGNSGGPLMDGQGRVIGMNTAISARGQGIGFAVASNAIKRVVKDILEVGHVVRPWIGVSMQDVTPVVTRRLGIHPRDLKGVVIAGVREGDPADRGGIHRGDVLTEANGKRLSGVDDLRAEIRSRRPGDRLRLQGLRDGKPRKWEVVLNEMPAADQIGNRAFRP